MRQPAQTQVDVVVLTALPLEYEAVRRLLEFRPGADDKLFEYEGTLFEIGRLPGGRQRIALAITGPGNAGAAVIAARASSGLRPAALIFVGVAGGLLDEVSLGDVVVASHVNELHSRKETPQGAQHRFKQWPTDHLMFRVAQQVAMRNAWRERLPAPERERQPKVHFKPLVAGEVVLSTDTAPKAEVRRLFPEAAAIEMESAGFAVAAHLSEPYRHLSIRGISDMAGGAKATTDQGGWQPRAAAIAAAFAVEVIASAAPVLTRVRPRARQRGSTRGRRMMVAAAIVAALLLLAGYLVFQLGIAAFHGGMEGVDLNGIHYGPIDYLEQVLAWMVLAVPILILAVGCWIVGAALVPSVGTGRVLLPATALAIVGWFSVFLVLSTFPTTGYTAMLVLFMVGVMLFGFLSTRVGKPRENHRTAGVFTGLGVVGTLMLWLTVGHRLLPYPWPAIILFGVDAIALVALGGWLVRELRRGGLSTGRTSSSEMLSSLFAALLLRRDDFRNLPRGTAKAEIVVMLLVPTLLIGLGIGWLPSWLEAQSTAGRAAVENGYLRVEDESALIPLTVRPVTISLRDPGVDPMDVCGRTPARAASLLATEGETRWILLRPIGEDDHAPATVLRLSSADYSVHRVLDRDLREDGRRWIGPACQQRR
nr:5'-methylthioadenosine/S-adenosylhomocysteine nucleosidase [Micromonospora sp. DSM 115978]